MKKTTIQEMHRLTVEEFHEAKKMPLVVVLDDVRSLYNVGSVFRTADAFRVEAIYLCGITATPAPAEGARECTLKASQEIHKTALGAEESVDWKYFPTALEAVEQLKANGYTVLAVEQCHGSIMLGPSKSPLKGDLDHPGEDLSEALKSPFKGDLEGPGLEGPYAVVLGNEVKGVHQEVVDACDACLEIPQYGTKHSLNVSVTGGIVIWHFASHYRQA